MLITGLLGAVQAFACPSGAGKQCQRVHQAIVEQSRLDLVHVQADEIRVKARGMVVWMGLALMVSTRLWLGGVVSPCRDTQLADRLRRQVRACCRIACEVLICTEGWAAYPGSIKRAFREKVKRTAGRGRAHLEIWSGLHIGTVIKHSVHKRLTQVVRQMSHGTLEAALCLLQRSGGGQMLNTSYIERFNTDSRPPARARRRLESRRAVFDRHASLGRRACRQCGGPLTVPSPPSRSRVPPDDRRAA